MTEQTMTPGEVLRVLDDCASKLAELEAENKALREELQTMRDAVETLEAGHG